MNKTNQTLPTISNTYFLSKKHMTTLTPTRYSNLKEEILKTLAAADVAEHVLATEFPTGAPTTSLTKFEIKSAINYLRKALDRFNC